MIGLSGVHLSGKTSLARRIEEYYSIPFVETHTAKIATSLGIRVSDPMGMHTRIRLQEALYEDYVQQFSKSALVFVSDRTFIDLVAYSYMDVSLSSPQYPNDWLPDFVARCLEQQCKFFKRTFLLRHVGGTPVGNKGCMSTDYLRVFDTIYSGLIGTTFPITAIIGNQSIDQRMDTVVHYLGDRHRTLFRQ